jgi:hypothetical protein
MKVVRAKNAFLNGFKHLDQKSTLC